jgi:hypothetical protein
MQLPRTFDAETAAMMGRVCYDAWWELRSLNSYPSSAAAENVRDLLALSVMEAVARGERDPAALRMIALAGAASRPDTARQPPAKTGAMVLS